MGVAKGMAGLAKIMKPEQFFLATNCTAGTLCRRYGLTRYEAEVAINKALIIVRQQRKLELLITSDEDKITEYATR